MQSVKYDDLEGLRKLINPEFGAFGPSLEITQAMVNQFAELTRDPQWIHVDVERAKRESPFGGPIVHGFFVLSLIAGLPPGERTPISGVKTTVNYGADKLRFVSPVPVGSTVHTRPRLADVQPKSGGTLLTNESE